MDSHKLQSFLRIFIRVLCLSAVILVVLHLTADIQIPGLLPIILALLFASSWGLFKLRGLIPARIYTFIYFLIVVLNLMAAASQLSQ